MKHCREPWTRIDSLIQPKHQEMDTRFGTWNVRSLYTTGSLKTVARELGMYKLYIMGVKEVRWKKGGTEWADDYILFMEKGMGIIG
jgi:hypothetical protein